MTLEHLDELAERAFAATLNALEGAEDDDFVPVPDAFLAMLDARGASILRDKEVPAGLLRAFAREAFGDIAAGRGPSAPREAWRSTTRRRQQR